MRQSKMSGRSKKILAVFLAAAMIAGNALTVLAEDVSGNNVETVEEKVEETSQESSGEASEEESGSQEIRAFVGVLCVLFFADLAVQYRRLPLL